MILFQGKTIKDHWKKNDVFFCRIFLWSLLLDAGDRCGNFLLWVSPACFFGGCEPIELGMIAPLQNFGIVTYFIEGECIFKGNFMYHTF